MALTIIPIEVWKVIALFLCDRWVIHTFSQTCKSFRYLRRYGCILPPQWRIVPRMELPECLSVRLSTDRLELHVTGPDGVERMVAQGGNLIRFYHSRTTYQCSVVESFKTGVRDTLLYIFPHDASYCQRFWVPRKDGIHGYQYFQGRVIAYSNQTSLVKVYNLDGTEALSIPMLEGCSYLTQIYALKTVCVLVDWSDTFAILSNGAWEIIQVEGMDRFRIGSVSYDHAVMSDTLYLYGLDGRGFKIGHMLVHFYQVNGRWHAKGFHQLYEPFLSMFYQPPNKVYHETHDDTMCELTLPRVLQLE